MRSFAIAFILAVFTAADSLGQQVVLAFEATVISTADAVPFDSGIDVDIGDPVSGLLVFQEDPGDGGDLLTVSQPNATATFNVAGATLNAVGYQIEVRNDAQTDGDCADLFCPTVFDLIEFRGFGYDSIEPSNSANLDLTTSGFALDVRWNADPTLGADGVWESALVSGDPEIWDTETLVASLQIWLRGTPEGASSMRASINRLTIIPEPSSAILLVCVIAGIRRIER